MEINLLGRRGLDRADVASGAPGVRVAAERLSREHVGTSLYELPPGESTFPYHYELGNDELLVVVAGRPTLRSPRGERELAPGDCILFPSGPEGAHQLTNRSDAPTRVLLVSNFALPRAAVQVDSNKMLLRWGAGPDDRPWFVVGEEGDYWDDEASADP